MLETFVVWSMLILQTGYSPPTFWSFRCGSRRKDLDGEHINRYGE